MPLIMPAFFWASAFPLDFGPAVKNIKQKISQIHVVCVHVCVYDCKEKNERKRYETLFLRCVYCPTKTKNQVIEGYLLSIKQ